MTQWTREEQAEHRRLWVEALRSGKYQQAQGQLREGVNSFCCLGVACEISGLDMWKGEAVPFYLGDNRMLPGPVRDWLGLNGKLGSYGPAKQRLYLADHNDAGMPFPQIADIIASEPPGLIAEPLPQ